LNLNYGESDDLLDFCITI